MSKDELERYLSLSNCLNEEIYCMEKLCTGAAALQIVSAV